MEQVNALGQDLEKRVSPGFGWEEVPSEPGLFKPREPTFSEDLYLSPWFQEHAERTSASYSPVEYFRVCARQAGGVKQLFLNELEPFGSALKDAYETLKETYQNTTREDVKKFMNDNFRSGRIGLISGLGAGVILEIVGVKVNPLILGAIVVLVDDGIELGNAKYQKQLIDYRKLLKDDVGSFVGGTTGYTIPYLLM